MEKKKMEVADEKIWIEQEVTVNWSTLYNEWLQHADEPNTYLLTPWCRVFFEKLTGLQLVKKSPAFHGT